MSLDGLLPSDAEFDALGASILDRSRRADRRRRRRTIATAAAITLAAGGGIAWVVLASQIAQDELTYCYGAADPDAEYTQAVRGDAPGTLRDEDGRLIDRPTDADLVEDCAAVWRSGLFEPGGVPADGVEVVPVPDLRLCVRPDGVSAVVPDDPARDELCRELGWRDPE